MRTKKEKRGCEPLLDLKMALAVFHYLSLPSATQMGVGNNSPYPLFMSFSPWLCATPVFRNLGTEGVGRNKISAKITQN